MGGGRTAHFALQLLLNIAEQQFPVSKISKASGRGELLKQAIIIFWDECTMAHKKSLEAMGRTLQDLRRNSEMMGGALFLLSGDFQQHFQLFPSQHEQMKSMHAQKIISLATHTNTATNKIYES